MACRLEAISLFLENRVEERKTSKRASVAVSMTCKRPAATSRRLPMLALLAANSIVAGSLLLHAVLVLRS